MIKLIGFHKEGKTTIVIMHSAINGYLYHECNLSISNHYVDIGNPSTVRLDSIDKNYAILIDDIELFHKLLFFLNKYLLAGKGILTITVKQQSFIQVYPRSEEDKSDDFAIVTDVQYDE